jgi:hypothetical protein
MRKRELERIEKLGNQKVIDSNASGLHYLMNAMLHTKQFGIEIAGLDGKTTLTITQARALIAELPELIELYC